ncbi:MAG: type III pantothenate kinase [Gammaproteobacteria bacterium]|nr:MAG: type III pantothenate kinase [Gammaproteobacteria bacterium]PIE39056.1 MAG: type III pantothenate kinase [Gammaproteobacteria bacterium]
MPDLCLQLDVGNSSAKWRLIDLRAPDTVLARGKLTDDSASEQALLSCSESLSDIWIASVANADNERALVAALRKRWQVSPWFARTSAQTGTLKNSYAQPHRMGVDRWLAMLAAQQRMAGRFCVVDAGSALTIDLVAATGEHEGGFIIPGVALMEGALLRDTQKVRYTRAVDYALTPGTSTAEAVRHGVALAQCGAVALILQREGLNFDQLVLCGGAGRVLGELLGGGKYVEDLVFEGLSQMALAAKNKKIS